MTPVETRLRAPLAQLGLVAETAAPSPPPPSLCIACVGMLVSPTFEVTFSIYNMFECVTVAAEDTVPVLDMLAMLSYVM